MCDRSGAPPSVSKECYFVSGRTVPVSGHLLAASRTIKTAPQSDNVPESIAHKTTADDTGALAQLLYRFSKRAGDKNYSLRDSIRRYNSLFYDQSTFLPSLTPTDNSALWEH